MKRISLLLIIFLTLASACNRVKPLKDLPSDSIFLLDSDWQNQKGETLKLKDLRGKTLIVVMIYTTCKASCPILVADMKKIEQQIKPEYLKKASLVLVSIDPETDTPERLLQFAKERKMDADHWILLRGNEASTQEFANVLSMKYKKISPIDFSHSNIISIFNPDGELVSQEEGVGINVEKVAQKVNETIKKS